MSDPAIYVSLVISYGSPPPTSPALLVPIGKDGIAEMLNGPRHFLPIMVDNRYGSQLKTSIPQGPYGSLLRVTADEARSLGLRAATLATKCLESSKYQPLTEQVNTAIRIVREAFGDTTRFKHCSVSQDDWDWSPASPPLKFELGGNGVTYVICFYPKVTVTKFLKGHGKTFIIKEPLGDDGKHRFVAEPE
jgi:hypothetical protein